MKVHLIKTLEYSAEARKDVLHLLQDTGNGLHFLEGDWEEVAEIDLPPLLSFPEIFGLCNTYRQQKAVPDGDFVVLLTTIPNEDNFFSFFDQDLNAFVHTAGWDYFGIGNAKYPVAYEVAANVLQSLMKLTETDIHFASIGCMNDMCENKKEVLLKLRTADICPDCLQKIEEQTVEERIVNQVLDVFEKVRSELMWAQGFRRNLQPKNVEITIGGNIRIGAIAVKLTFMERMLMIFFLRHLEGVLLKDLGDDFEDDLLDIYHHIRPGAPDARCQISKFVDPVREYKTFSTTKNRLNKKLVRTLGNFPSRFYQLVREPDGVFKVQGPLVEIIDNFVI